MGMFALKCPRCGIELEAEEKHIGLDVKCGDCNHIFPLKKPLVSKNKMTSLAQNEEIVAFSAEDISLAYTKPVRMYIADREYEVNAWKAVWRIVITWLFDTYANDFDILVDSQFSDITRRIYLRSTSGQLIAPTKISDDLWLESNFSANEVVSLSRELIELFDLSASTVNVVYTRKKVAPRGSASKETPIQELLFQDDTNEDKFITKSEFVKHADYSFFTAGFTIPVKKHHYFLNNLNSPLQPGDSREINVIFEKKQYPAVINYTAAKLGTRLLLQVRWRKTSAIASALRARYPELYDALYHYSSDISIAKEFSISCGPKKNEIVLFCLTSPASIPPPHQQEKVPAIESTTGKTQNPLSSPKDKPPTSHYERAMYQNMRVNLGDLISDAIKQAQIEEEALEAKKAKIKEEYEAQQKEIMGKDLLSASLSDFDFTFAILKKMYEKGFDFEKQAKELQTLQWCQHNLGLRLPVLRNLRPFETLSDFRETFALLSPTATWMVYRLQKNLNRQNFVSWVKRNGFGVADIANALGIKIVSVPQPASQPASQPVSQPSPLQEPQKRLAVSDKELVMSAVDLLYRKGLLTERVLANLQSRYYCLQNYGVTEPILRRQYANDAAVSDWSVSYDYWKNGPVNPSYYVLKVCSGLQRRFFLNFLVQTGISLDKLAERLDCDVACLQRSDSVKQPKTPSVATSFTQKYSSVITEKAETTRGIAPEKATETKAAEIDSKKKTAINKSADLPSAALQKTEASELTKELSKVSCDTAIHKFLEKNPGASAAVIVEALVKAGHEKSKINRRLNNMVDLVRDSNGYRNIPEYEIQKKSKSLSGTISSAEEKKIDAALTKSIKESPGQHKDVLTKQIIQQGFSALHVERRIRELEKVLCAADRYYSIDDLYGFKDAADAILETLQDLFAQNDGYTSAQELYRAASGRLDDFFYDNDAFDSEVEVYQLAQYLFETTQYKNKSFIFYNRVHIWQKTPDYPMNDQGLLIHWARQNGGLLTTDLAYANLLRRGVNEGSKTATFSLAITKAYDQFLTIDANTWLLKENVHITDAQLNEIKTAMDALFDEFELGFVPMWDIADEWFTYLPKILPDYDWTPMLLQSVLRDYSKELRYRTIPRMEQRQLHAAIVRNNSALQDYSDLVYCMLKAEFRAPSIKIHRNDLFDLLIKKGLWPEDVTPSYGNTFQNLFKDNFHFHFVDKNTLEVG